MSETMTAPPATETLTVVSPDISITKTERFNNTRLAQLLANPDLSAEDRVYLCDVCESAALTGMQPPEAFSAILAQLKQKRPARNRN